MSRRVKIAGLAALVGIAAAVGVFLYIERIAKVAIERGASYALGVPTAVDSVSIGVLSGESGLKGLRVANPSGFATPHFLTLDEASLRLRLGSLREETIVVPLLVLKGIDVNLEWNNRKTNYGVVLGNLRRRQSGGPPPSGEPGTGRRFIIDRLVIEDVTTRMRVAPLGGELTTREVRIPEIRLTGIGSNSDRGVLLAELTGVVVTAILRAVAERGRGLPGELASTLRGGLSGLERIPAEVLGEAGKAVGGAAPDLGERAREALEEAGKLFKRR